MNNLVYVGLRGRVAALDRATGKIVWRWEGPRNGYVTLLVEADLLVVSVNGYTYGLHPDTGTQLWAQDLPGFRTGVACLASLRSSSDLASVLLGAADTDDQAEAAAASTTTTT